MAYLTKRIAYDDQKFLELRKDEISNIAPDLKSFLEETLDTIKAFQGYQFENLWENMDYLQYSKPASIYCGDYHYRFSDQERLDLALLDCMAHGCSAASIAARIHLYSMQLKESHHPAPFLKTLHDQMVTLIQSKNNEEELGSLISQFAHTTANVVMIQKNSKVLYSNVSNCPILWYHHQTHSIEELSIGSWSMLGMVSPDTHTGEIEMSVNDLLILYSDGIQFDPIEKIENQIEILKTMILKNSDRPLTSIRNLLIQKISPFQSDDLAFTLIRRKN